VKRTGSAQPPPPTPSPDVPILIAAAPEAAAPAPAAAPATLPKTASELPLIGLLGVVLCGISLIATGIRKITA